MSDSHNKTMSRFGCDFVDLITITDSMKNARVYDGTTRKFGVTIGNADYIVKFPKDVDLSVYCEYVASNFIRALGISCHRVYLGIYKNVVVNVIRDFTVDTGLSLHTYKETKQSSEDTDISTKEYTYSDILYLFDNHLKMSDKEKMTAKHRFWQMFICDAILANRDRHWGNWGYLVDSNGRFTFAPLYDNGACLFPGVSNVIQGYLNANTRKDFLRQRVFVFPASLFKICRPDRAYRSNYYEVFKDLRVNKIFAEEVRKLKQAFTYDSIFRIMFNIVKDIPLDISIKAFYIEVVTLRYMCIVLRMDYDKAYGIVEKLMKAIVA